MRKTTINETEEGTLLLALNQFGELFFRCTDEDDELSLFLASSADGIEAGVVKGIEE